MTLALHEHLYLGWAILLASAVFAPLLSGRRRAAGRLTFALTLLAGLAFARAGTLAILAGAHAAGAAAASHAGAHVARLGGLAVPLLVDGVSGLLLLLIAFMSSLCALHAVGYLDHAAGGRSVAAYHLNFPLFVGGMYGVVTADDLSGGFTLAWQAMTLASFFLIRFDGGDPAVRRAANKYLLLMEVAWAAILAGAFAIPGAAWGDALPVLAAKLAAGSERLPLALLLLLFGFGMKAGVFPLGQLWLPDAHSAAPAPVSALLSGVMIKTGAFGVLRILFWMLPAAATPLTANLGLAVALFGGATLFLGTVQALKQEDAKRLHAYSSIGQMGYILLALGSAHALLGGFAPTLRTLGALALAAGLFHLVNHALFKGLLFLCTGSVQAATGTRDLGKLGGLLPRMPQTALAAAVGCAAIAGIPGFSGFASKWALVAAGLLAGPAAPALALLGLVALMTNAVTLALYVKFFGMTFTAAGAQWHAKGEVREVEGAMLAPQAALAAASLALGLAPAWAVSAILAALAASPGSSAHAVFTDPALAAALIHPGAGGLAVALPGAKAAVAAAVPILLAGTVLAALAAASWLRGAGGAPARTAPAWLCGYRGLANDTRYASRHMFAPFKNFLRWTGGNA